MQQAMTHVKHVGFRPASYNFNPLWYRKQSESNLLRINGLGLDVLTQSLALSLVAYAEWWQQATTKSVGGIERQ